VIKRSRLAQAIAKTDFDYIPFVFGLDLVTPSNQTKPGSLRICKNAEIDVNGGYRMINGYIKFDGQSLGETNTFYTVGYVDGTGDIITAGVTVTEATGPTTATVLAVNTDDGDNRFLVLADVDGPDLESGQTLTFTGGTVVLTGDLITGGAPTSQLNAIYTQLASIYWQSFIDPVPGAGHILGIWMTGTVVYALRNNVGETAAAMWVSSGSGWTSVALGREMAFTSGGVQEILEGDTIEGMSSGATALVTRVVLESGSWDAGTAAGRFIFASQSGPFTPAEAIEVGASGDIATATDAGAAITLLPDGRYEFVEHNFQGSRGNKRMYGCDGVNRCFEFDPVSSVFAPINTPLSTDAPSHIVVHKEHLFISYLSSILHSGIGAPYNWTTLAGAAELVQGDEVTAFKRQPGSAEGRGTLVVFSRNRIKILYGSNSGELAEGGWDFVDFRDEVGAIPNSVQEFGFTLMVDDRGIISLEAAQEFGNFASNVVSKYVQPIMNERGHTVRDSSINRERSQYRIFFADSSALYLTTQNAKVMGIMLQQFEHEVWCVTSRERSDGREASYFGSADGWVYKMDTGTSFAGEPIDHQMALHFHHSKSPRYEKTYLDGSFEIAGTEYGEFYFRYELAYNLPTTPQPSAVMVDVNLSEPYWDAMTWDAFTWDGNVLAPSNVDINGSGENISLIFSSNVNYANPMTISGAALRLAYRKQLRS